MCVYRLPENIHQKSPSLVKATFSILPNPLYNIETVLCPFLQGMF